ncbi:hypothetical protein SCA6_015995 [Theobroma cacao]|uniref:Uncharacterized protein LOC18603305 isoform X1 n=2 Tax=Theobroma cacao TaxID=3641 RepID=A0AB32V8X8_THECC|nr:PREDICTED: uncharacterized protein LOC18603305 isoform X1 [Theobroma cacao]
MYPRVKVKEQGQDDQYAMHDYKISSVLSLKDVLFLSMLDSYFPVKTPQDVSPIAKARIPESYVPEVEKPSDSAPAESEKNNKATDEEDRPNIRVSLTPRPRAVISSPENDAVIGHNNRIKGEHCAALKNHLTVQNRHTTRSHIFARSSVKTRKSKDDADSNFEIKPKKGSGTTVSSQRRHHRTERPSWQDP